jgi:hypothetical protein
MTWCVCATEDHDLGKAFGAESDVPAEKGIFAVVMCLCRSEDVD